MTFLLMIRIKLAKEMVEEFKERWGKLAKYCFENEPDTLSYELCVGEQDDTEFMIIEVRP
jgi:quinol monooxygenase YgiN